MSIQEATKKGERHVRKPASAGRSNRVLVAVGTPGNAGWWFIPNIWKNKSHVPNHQPELVSGQFSAPQKPAIARHFQQENLLPDTLHLVVSSCSSGNSYLIAWCNQGTWTKCRFVYWLCQRLGGPQNPLECKSHEITRFIDNLREWFHQHGFKGCWSCSPGGQMQLLTSSSLWRLSSARACNTQRKDFSSVQQAVWKDESQQGASLWCNFSISSSFLMFYDVFMVKSHSSAIQ